MNHIKLRRFALSAAAVSFGVLTALTTIWVSTVGCCASATQAPLEAHTLQTDTDSLPGEIDISCTPLVVKQLAAYDGKFFEDGSGREVVDVAAVMLYNSSDRLIPYAYLTVYTENCRYTFDAFMLPPKSSVLVPEKSAQKLTETAITDTFGWTTVQNAEQRPALDIREQGMGCLQIKNLSGKKVRELTVYYKNYIADGDFYVGGRAFSVCVEQISPGDTAVIFPDNYAAGYSRVIHYQ